MNKDNVQALYPLTGMQQGFLWHSMNRAGHSGLVQTRARLEGKLHPTAFDDAWAGVIARHEGLRATVHWRKVKQPIQLIARTVAAPVTWLDWRAHSNHEQALHDWLADDMAQGLDADRAPAFRMTLIRLADDVYELVWTAHHMLIDGWSGTLALTQLLQDYDRACAGQAPQPGRTSSLRPWVQWRKAADTGAASRYWTETLTGASPSLALAHSRQTATGLADTHQAHATPFSDVAACLSVAETTELTGFVRNARLTLNAVLQGAWALVLARLCGQTDVVFGVTVSGRPAELNNADQLIGMLVNVVPVRISPEPTQTMRELLTAVNTRAFSNLQFSFADLSQIFDWAGASGELFDSLLVVQNRPSMVAAENLRVSQMSSGTVSGYDLTLTAIPGATSGATPGEQLELNLRVNGPAANAVLAQAMLDEMRRLLIGFAANPAQTVAEILQQAPANPALISPAKATAPPENSGPAKDAHDSGHETAPVSYAEARMQRLWANVLGVAKVGSQESFFALGGSSLQAIRLFTQVEEAFGRKLAPTTLFQADTVQALVALLNADNAQAGAADLVELQAGTHKAPLFIVDVSTDLLLYRPLVAALGADQPVYGFRGRERRDTALADLAGEYIKLLRTVQPEGSYAVAGYSGGGVLAWHMAQQLRADGHEVRLLALLDTMGPDAAKLLPPLARVGSCLRGGWHDWRNRRHETVHIQLRGEASPAGSSDSALRRFRGLARSLTAGFGPGEALANLICLALLKLLYRSDPVAWPNFRQAVWNSARKTAAGRELANHNYSARVARDTDAWMFDGLPVYDGPVLLIRATLAAPGVVTDPVLGWQAVAGGPIQVQDVQGNHLSMIAPARADAMASIFLQALKD